MRISNKRTAAAAGTITLGLWVGLGTGLGYAASPSELACDAQGGTFFKSNGTVYCQVTTVDPVGNSESSDGQSQTRDTTKTGTGQGNYQNKETTSSTCQGPGNAKCS